MDIYSIFNGEITKNQSIVDSICDNIFTQVTATLAANTDNSFDYDTTAEISSYPDQEQRLIITMIIEKVRRTGIKIYSIYQNQPLLGFFPPNLDDYRKLHVYWKIRPSDEFMKSYV